MFSSISNVLVEDGVIIVVVVVNIVVVVVVVVASILKAFCLPLFGRIVDQLWKIVFFIVLSSEMTLVTDATKIFEVWNPQLFRILFNVDFQWGSFRSRHVTNSWFRWNGKIVSIFFILNCTNTSTYTYTLVTYYMICAVIIECTLSLFSNHFLSKLVSLFLPLSL